MTRTIYRCLVWLHPPVFRREFSDEMLCIFDEAAQTESLAPLFLDGLISLARQWFLRSGCWKILAAIAGGMFQISLGGVLMLSIVRQRAMANVAASGNPELFALMRLVAFTAIGLLAAVILLVVCWRRLVRQTGV